MEHTTAARHSQRPKEKEGRSGGAPRPRTTTRTRPIRGRSPEWIVFFGDMTYAARTPPQVVMSDTLVMLTREALVGPASSSSSAASSSGGDGGGRSNRGEDGEDDWDEDEDDEDDEEEETEETEICAEQARAEQQWSDTVPVI